MRRATLTALVLMAGLVLPGSASANAGGILPVKSSMTGISEVNLATGQVHAVLSGPSSHAGLTAFDEHGQLAPTGQPGLFNFFSSWTMTVANGDQVLGNCSGTVTTSDGVHFTLLLDCTSTSGTGRFEGISLSFAATIHSTRVSVDPSTGIATNELESSAEGTATRPGAGGPG